MNDKEIKEIEDKIVDIHLEQLNKNVKIPYDDKPFLQPIRNLLSLNGIIVDSSFMDRLIALNAVDFYRMDAKRK